MVTYISCPKLACLCRKTYVRFETALSTAKKHTRCPPKAAASCTQNNRRDRSQSNEKEDTGHMYRGVQRETNLKLRQADMFCDVLQKPPGPKNAISSPPGGHPWQ